MNSSYHLPVWVLFISIEWHSKCDFFKNPVEILILTRFFSISLNNILESTVYFVIFSEIYDALDALVDGVFRNFNFYNLLQL